MKRDPLDQRVGGGHTFSRRWSCDCCGTPAAKRVAVVMDGAIAMVGSSCARKFRRARSSDLIRDLAKSSLAARVMGIRAKIAKAAQKVVDEWEQDEEGMNEELGVGGVCDRVAEAVGSVIVETLPGVDITSGGQDGDDHAFVIAYDDKSAVAVDIPANVYETGGGYHWKKIHGAAIEPGDVVVEEIDRKWVVTDASNRAGSRGGYKYDGAEPTVKRSALLARLRKLSQRELEELPIELLDKAAFGFTQGDRIRVTLKYLATPFLGDLEAAADDVRRNPRGWVNALREPLDVRYYHGRLELVDGHHRYVTARRLGKRTLPAEVVRVEDNPIVAIMRS